MERGAMDRGERLDAQEAALDALLADLGVEYRDEPDERVLRLAEREPRYPQYHRIGHKRQSACRALADDRAAAEKCFAAALRALVRDDDPSSPRWLVQALVAAVGRRRVLEALIDVAEHGTAYERGCAVGAWRWAEAPLRYASEEARLAGRPTATSRAERAALADLDTRFRAACRAVLADCPDDWARERLTELGNEH